MSTIIAYAVSILLNMGVITSADVNRTADSIRVIERDGKTVIVSVADGHEIIVY